MQRDNEECTPVSKRTRSRGKSKSTGGYTKYKINHECYLHNSSNQAKKGIKTNVAKGSRSSARIAAQLEQNEGGISGLTNPGLKCVSDKTMEGKETVPIGGMGSPHAMTGVLCTPNRQGNEINIMQNSYSMEGQQSPLMGQSGQTIDETNERIKYLGACEQESQQQQQQLQQQQQQQQMQQQMQYQMGPSHQNVMNIQGEQNPSKLPNMVHIPQPIQPLLNVAEMGNNAALGMAMNKMYEDLLSALRQHTDETNKKFNMIANDISAIRETGNQMSDKVSRAIEQIEELKINKVNKEDLQKTTEDIKCYKEEMEKKFKEQENKLEAYEKRLQGLSKAVEDNRYGITGARCEMFKLDADQKLDRDRIKNTLGHQVERINILELKRNKLHLNIDGVPENDSVSPALLIITKFNEDAEAGLKETDISSAWRIGTKIPDAKDVPALQGKVTKTIKKKPRTISVILASETARDKIMSSRNKLKKYDDDSYLWVNEDQPDAYRRRKSMLRDLVKLAKKKGYKDAKIEAGGIKINGQTYTPESFDELPEEIRPRQVRIRQTKSGGLAFCSEWAYLSNMYCAPFQYNGRGFSSAEQCYQAEKALFHNRNTLAERIIRTEDPHKCKKLGGEVKDNSDWIGAREKIMRNIVHQKFAQNEKLKKELIETGTSSLFEAVSGGEIWSINSSIYSKATFEETATGPNALGKILEGIREGFTKQTS